MKNNNSTTLDTIFLNVSCPDNPDIGVIEVNPTKGIDSELLKVVLEEHFDCECAVIGIINANDIDTFNYTAIVKIDVTDCNYDERITFERAFVYLLNYL